MDLILLQPGNASIFGNVANSWSNGGSLVDNRLPADSGGISLGQCLELVSMSQGVVSAAGPASEEVGSPGPRLTEFTCVKYLDKTSVALYERCLSREPLGRGAAEPTVIYILRNSGDKTANIMTIQLRDAVVSEIEMQTHPDDMPTEQFKLVFNEIIWTYKVQNANMTSVGDLSAGWSLIHNRSIKTFS